MREGVASLLVGVDSSPVDEGAEEGVRDERGCCVSVS
jgi:hypothetical protein